MEKKTHIADGRISDEGEEMRRRQNSSIQGQRSRAAFAVTCLAAALCFSVLVPKGMLCAQAAPEFARSAEEWDALRDNKLEWSEIPGLVNEYNATVLNNKKAYQKDSGQDAQEYRNALLDAADDMDELASQVEGNGEGGDMTAVQYRIQAEQLRSSADNNVADSDVIRWQYSQAEASIVQAVRNDFIGYYQALLEKEAGEIKVPYMEQLLRSAENRKNVGTGTQLEVLEAKENLQNAQAALLSADASINSYKKKMQVLCGWNYEADAEIGALPEFEADSILAIDPDADTETALQNNWQLMIDTRKLANAPDSTLREQYQKTVNTDQQQIRASVKSAYDSLTLAKTDSDAAKAELTLKQKNFEKSARQYGLGTISRMEYAAAENEVKTLENTARQKELAVFTAWAAYDSAVNGLASTGGTQ
ncbi:MAG: TolC family protein [Eubacteriales bacterium]|nr:TolC family protein [Eubacteriales bacterium]